MRDALAIAAALLASAAADAPGQPAERRLDWPGKAPGPAAARPAVAAPDAPARPDAPRRDTAASAVTPDPTALSQDFFLDGAAVDLADPPPQPLSERDERRLRAEATSPDTQSN